jgi:hypothetical protein
MAAFEVAQTVGGEDIATTLDDTGYATITIGATSGDNRISQDYDHLYLTFSSRNGHSAYFQYLLYEFNDDNDYDYSYTNLYTRSSTPASGSEGPADGIRGIMGDYCAANSLLADTFSTNTLWIPHYANISNFTSTISTTILPNGSGTDHQWVVGTTAGLYAETGAITQIRMKPGGAGAEFWEHSSYVLYGITGV